MSITFRNNCDFSGFTDDYDKVRTFLLKLNNPNYLFGRWDWMYTHGWLDKTGLSKIGLWEDKGEMIALATYDCQLGKSYFCVLDAYNYLKPDMLVYSRDAFAKDGEYKALISDTDTHFQDIAAANGFVPTQEKESDAYYPINMKAIDYKLPQGLSIFSMKDHYDIYKYGEVLWKGFNHELNGEGKFNPDEDKLAALNHEMKRPNVNLDIKIVVSAPNGDFVSYCGMWQDANTNLALVEPVATVPEYRKLGLGKAAVLEGIKRCGQLGSTKAWVGSSQQFYYTIGFRPWGNATWWKAI